MRPAWLWDRDISQEEARSILKDPQNERFVNIGALLLSRNNTPKEIFDQYFDQKVFVQNWGRIKRQMRKDSWNDPRIIFWQAVYEKLAAGFKEKGIEIFQRKPQKRIIPLSQKVAQMVKDFRIEEGLTQKGLAEKLKISQQIISRIESGRENLSLATLEKFKEAFGGRIDISVTLESSKDHLTVFPA